MCINVNSCQTAQVLARTRAKRIIEGNPAAPNEFPHQAQIRAKDLDEHICGGTIIGEWYILTAAHCFEEQGAWDFPKNIEVAVGSINFNANGATRRGVEKYYVPNEFHPETLDYDIAILKVSKIINSEKIHTVK